jgi:hypothetical protein
MLITGLNLVVIQSISYLNNSRSLETCFNIILVFLSRYPISLPQIFFPLTQATSPVQNDQELFNLRLYQDQLCRL